MLSNDRQLIISAAGNRKATLWQGQRVYWSELIGRLSTPVRSQETLAEYLRLPKAKQDDLKDVGGYVGGELAEGRRKAVAVLSRDIVTLDMDNIASGGTLNALQRIDGLGCGYCVHSTRKHEENRPRLRVLIPLNHPVSADEYEAISRKLAEIIGIELCDPSTFEACRLMYWPNCCADGQFVFNYADKPMLDAQGMLALYKNWRDISQWPQVPGTAQPQIKLAEKQGDPRSKPGVVGAFCKVYDVYKALGRFLPGVYSVVDNMPERLTYCGGSTAGGAVVYDNGNFLFSHHATDPCSGKLVNAFDLVRLHLFGAQDFNVSPDTPINRLPSYVAMQEMAAQDAAVTAYMAEERVSKAADDFTDIKPEAGEDNAWLKKLAFNPNTGKPAQCIDNVYIILENDMNLKGMFSRDLFSNREFVNGTVPWNKKEGTRWMTDADEAGIRHYMEKCYGITGKDRISDAVELCLTKHSMHEVKEYLTSLSWDGVKRLETIFVDYLGAEDNAYNRAVARKSLCAAVARVMTPGVKYDTMPILEGRQGIGKSTLIRLLGKSWFNDSLATFDGKEAQETIQGSWIIELGELKGVSKSELSTVKSFLSKCEDVFRVAYGKRVNKFPRQCVFFGTTNEAEFLRDHTGNRRFWPVKLGVQQSVKNVWRELPLEVDQIWAETFAYWQLGEALTLPKNLEPVAEEMQETYTETSSLEGVILEFIDKPVPLDWDKRTPGQRQLYWSADFGSEKVLTELRKKICPQEIWVEALDGDLKKLTRASVGEINAVIHRTGQWEKPEKAIRCGCHGVVRGWVRKE